MAILALAALVAMLPACARLKTDPPTEGTTVEANGDLRFRGLLMDGNVYPSDQFHFAPADRCDDFHWHKATVAVAIGAPGPQNIVVCPTGNNFPTRRDPDPNACGFGKLTERPSIEYRTSSACYSAWQTAESAAH